MSSARDGVGGERRSAWPAWLVVLAGVGVVCGLAQAQDAKPPAQKKRLAVDFRTPVENLASIVLNGPEVTTLAQTDERGLRIHLPGEKGDAGPVGLELPTRARGDFDVTLSYEKLAIHGAVSKNGAGLALRVVFDSPASLAVLMTRIRNPSGDVIETHRIHTGAEKKPVYEKQSVKARAEEESGKLRLVRTGAQLEFWVAEGKSALKRIRSLKIGNEDVNGVRVYCTRNRSPAEVDVRLTELVLQADQFPDSASDPGRRVAADEPAGKGPPVAVPGQPNSLGWLLPALYVGVPLVGLLAVFFVWRTLRRRRQRKAAKAPEPSAEKAARPEASPGVVSFACPECGHPMKVKADQAGKRGKCRHCGKPIVVPSEAASAADHTSD